MALEKLIQDIVLAERDFKSPISEELFAKVVNNIVIVLAALAGDSSKLLQGAIDITPAAGSPSFITDANPTAGTIDRDDKFNDLYIHFLDGTIFSNNSRNRFKITDTDAGADTVTVAENLNTLGATIGDTYEILGHTHDGAANPDGSKIDGKSLTNVAEDTDVTQGEWDALTDPDSLRGEVASKTNPFVTVTGAAFPVDGIFLWDKDGSCPPGSSRVTAFDNRVMVSAATPGTNAGLNTQTIELDAGVVQGNTLAGTNVGNASGGGVNALAVKGGSGGGSNFTERDFRSTTADVRQASRTILLCKKL